MARHSRLKTLTWMKEIGVVPVFYHADVEVARQVLCACADGGAVAVEFTNRGDRAVDVFARLEAYAAEHRPEIVLGVGSIVDAPTAAMYLSAGANFVVGPVLDEATATLCNTRKVPYCPGCGSASEIHCAHALGVEICKVFPGGAVGGPGFAKAIKGPMPWTDLMPTGGVSPTRESLAEWFGAGVACAGIGSKLITKDLLAAGDYAGIAENVRQAIDLVREIRQAT